MTKEAPRSFAMVLQELDRGLVHAELSEQLVELVRAVEELGKSGSITLKLTLDPGKNARGEGSLEHLEARAEVTVKKPGKSFGGSLFFITEEGNLTRRNQRQGDIEDVPGVRNIT